MIPHTRDLQILINATEELITERWENPFARIDLDKYYSRFWLNEPNAVGDTPKSSTSVRLPKLRTDQKLVSSENVEITPNEEEIAQLRLFAVIRRHVALDAVTHLLTTSSKYIQRLIEWSAGVNRFVTLAQFILCPSTKNRITERIASVKRSITNELSRVVCGSLSEATVERNEHPDSKSTGESDDNDDDGIANNPTGNKSVGDDPESDQETELIADRLIAFTLPELSCESFKSEVEWDRQVTHTSKSSFNPLTSVPYMLLNYFDVVASTDQSGLCKLLAAPIVKFLTRKRIQMHESCAFSDIDLKTLQPADTHSLSPVLHCFLAIRAFELIQICHGLVDLVKHSPEVINGPLTELILARPDEDFGSRNLSSISRVFCAIRNGSLPVVQYLLRTGKVRHTTAVDADGRNVLIAAVSAGKADIVRYLITELSPPININAKSGSGNTALHVAVSQNNVEITRLLLETGGAAVDITNSNGNGATPLHMAAMFGYAELVELLVRQSANLDARTTTSDRLTPVQLAQMGHHRDLTVRIRQLAAQQSDSIASGASSNTSIFLTKNVFLDRMRRNFETTTQSERTQTNRERTPLSQLKRMK